MINHHHNMSSLNSLHHTIRSLASRRYTCPPFKLQQGGQSKQAVASLKQVVSVLSGGQPGKLLAAWFKQRSNDVASVLREVKNELQLPLLSRLRTALELAPNGNMRKQLLSLISLDMGVAACKALDIPTTSKQHTASRKHASTSGAGMPVPKPVQPISKRPLNEATMLAIEQLMIDNSIPAANRTSKSKGQLKPVRYLKTSMKKLLAIYNSNPANRRLSISTLYKHRPKHIKLKAYKRTDVCAICHSGQIKHTQLNKLFHSIHSSCSFFFIFFFFLSELWVYYFSHFTFVCFISGVGGLLFV